MHLCRNADHWLLAHLCGRLYAYDFAAWLRVCDLAIGSFWIVLQFLIAVAIVSFLLMLMGDGIHCLVFPVACVSML